jgi:hypothetical protein
MDQATGQKIDQTIDQAINQIIKRRSKMAWLGALWLLACVSVSCGTNTKGVSKECKLNSDQKASLIGHWSVRPVPVAIISNDFSSSELAAIEAAIETWNEFFKVSKGFRLYLAGSAPLATVPSSTQKVTRATVCSQALLNANGFHRPILIQKNRSDWPYGSGVMALTSTCTAAVAGASTPAFYSGVIELNFKDFYNSGQPIPDLQSTLAHELGHLLGLKHSCSAGADKGVVSCSAASEEYRDALMYPALGFYGNKGKVSRNLRTNDQQRANCLY